MAGTTEYSYEIAIAGSFSRAPHSPCTLNPPLYSKDIRVSPGPGVEIATKLIESHVDGKETANGKPSIAEER